MGADGVRDLFGEVWPAREHVAVARDELTVMAGDMRQRAEAVELYFVQPVGMIEGLRNPTEAHRPQRRRIHSTHRN